MRAKPTVPRRTQTSPSSSWPPPRGRTRPTTDSARRHFLRSSIHRHDRLREIIEVRHRFYRRWRQSTLWQTAVRRSTQDRQHEKKPTAREENSCARRLLHFLSRKLLAFRETNYPFWSRHENKREERTRE